MMRKRRWRKHILRGKRKDEEQSRQEMLQQKIGRKKYRGHIRGEKKRTSRKNVQRIF